MNYLLLISDDALQIVFSFLKESDIFDVSESWHVKLGCVNKRWFNVLKKRLKQPNPNWKYEHYLTVEQVSQQCNNHNDNKKCFFDFQLPNGYIDNLTPIIVSGCHSVHTKTHRYRPNCNKITTNTSKNHKKSMGNCKTMLKRIQNEPLRQTTTTTTTTTSKTTNINCKKQNISNPSGSNKVEKQLQTPRNFPKRFLLNSKHRSSGTRIQNKRKIVLGTQINSNEACLYHNYNSHCTIENNSSTDKKHTTHNTQKNSDTAPCSDNNNGLCEKNQNDNEKKKNQFECCWSNNNHNHNHKYKRGEDKCNQFCLTKLAESGSLRNRPLIQSRFTFDMSNLYHMGDKLAYKLIEINLSCLNEIYFFNPNTFDIYVSIADISLISKRNWIIGFIDKQFYKEYYLNKKYYSKYNLLKQWQQQIRVTVDITPEYMIFLKYIKKKYHFKRNTQWNEIHHFCPTNVYTQSNHDHNNKEKNLNNKRYLMELWIHPDCSTMMNFDNFGKFTSKQQFGQLLKNNVKRKCNCGHEFELNIDPECKREIEQKTSAVV